MVSLVFCCRSINLLCYEYVTPSQSRLPYNLLKRLKYVVEFYARVITSFIHRCAQPEIIMCTDWVLHFIVMF
jgi:hypothetical protein